jgi:hypothetical protein
MIEDSEICIYLIRYLQKYKAKASKLKRKMYKPTIIIGNLTLKKHANKHKLKS